MSELDDVRGTARLSPSAVLSDALSIYKLLFQRSVTAAAVVYAAIALVEIVHHAATGAAAQALALVAFALSLAGPLIVQGGLVEIVRNVHEGRPPADIAGLFKRGGQRFWPLLGAAFLYGFGVAFGALLLLVPGLIVAARWSLIVPLVMLEGRGVGDARRRSSELVKGQTGRVLCCVIVTYLVPGLAAGILISSHLSFATSTFLIFLWSSVTAPFQAHVLTVVYYRLSDSGRPVIHPAVAGWRSVWEGR